RESPPQNYFLSHTARDVRGSLDKGTPVPNLNQQSGAGESQESLPFHTSTAPCKDSRSRSGSRSLSRIPDNGALCIRCSIGALSFDAIETRIGGCIVCVAKVKRPTGTAHRCGNGGPGIEVDRRLQ